MQRYDYSINIIPLQIRYYFANGADGKNVMTNSGFI